MRPMILAMAVIFCLTTTTVLAQHWAFASRAGGAENDYGARLATDDAGNSYVVGEFSGTASFDTITLTGQGRWSLYLAKYNPGGRVVWARVLAHTTAPTSDVYANTIALDRWGRIYVAGRFLTDVTFSGTTRTSLGSSDMYLAKLDGDGSLLWLRTPGGAGVGSYGQDAITAIALDSTGNCYITGSYNTDARFDTISLSSQLTYEAFVAKYDSAGHALWARSGGGTGSIHIGQGIAVDGAGNCYITGKFFNTLSFGPYTFDAVDAEQKAFIAKADRDGKFLWAGEVGSGGYYGAGQDVAVDDAGNAYVVGQFRQTVDFGTKQQTYGSGNKYALLVVAYGANGAYRWSAQSDGAAQAVSAVAVRLGREGNVFVAGACSGTVDIGSTTFINPEGHGSAFIAGLDSTGAYRFAERVVGLGSVVAAGLAVTADGSPEIIGSFSDSIGIGTGRLLSAGKLDMFFARLDLKSTGVERPAIAEDRLPPYPNPAHDIVRLGGVGRYARIGVYAIDGTRVRDAVYGDGVDLRGLPAGVYLVEAGGRVCKVVKAGE